ncbi:MAG: S41 family peptidase [Sphingobacteriales bacterium]|nr:MAG: S41 family peptidase [Sphingobacteriales bacterium]
MNDPRLRRLYIWTPILFAAILALGMTLGFRMQETLRNKRDIGVLIERNDRLEEIIDLIQERYVDTVNVNGLYQDAVEGIISHLDPHTSYIPAADLGGVNDDLEGSFFGIGVEFDIIRDTIQVTSVVDKGPADRAGVQIGDKIIKVNDSAVAGVGITSERIIRMLRGKQFSQATVSLQGAESATLRKAVIVRDAIPIYSVDATLLLDSTTGYIKINRFAAKTHEEFVKALRGLQENRVTSLILDLRQNPGGFLEQAVAVADELLAMGRTIVRTKNRTEETISKAERPGLYESGKLVVLVDEGSASAAEIVAGAVQDNDRGLVIGRRTFGKGLVQEQFGLGDGSALRITVARYYTPSGRSLQRSYAAGRAAYAEDLANRYHTGELTGRTEDVTGLDTATYYTNNHRKVRGGGGVIPDVLVPYDSITFNTPLLALAYNETAGLAVWEYYLQHVVRLRRLPNVAALMANRAVADTLVQNLAQRLPAADQEALLRIRKKPQSYAFLQNQLLARLARLIFRSNGYYGVLVPKDPMVIKAREALKSSVYNVLEGR